MTLRAVEAMATSRGWRKWRYYSSRMASPKPSFSADKICVMPAGPASNIVNEVYVTPQARGAALHGAHQKTRLGVQQLSESKRISVGCNLLIEQVDAAGAAQTPHACLPGRTP